MKIKFPAVLSLLFLVPVSAPVGEKTTPGPGLNAGPPALYPARIYGPAIYHRRPPYWLKGNLHAHTSRSDGDSTPWQVAKWYQSHGYDFLAITDHNKVTPVHKLQKYFPNMVLLPGEELTGFTRYRGFHVNLVGNSRRQYPYARRVARLRKYRNHRGRLVKYFRDLYHPQKVLVMVNHPHWVKNFNRWNIRQLPSGILMEIFNSDPTNHTRRGYDGFSDEDYWDLMLTNGKLVYGTATDDVHTLYNPKGKKMAALPGGGYVVVATRAKTEDHIVDSLTTGNFYASNGLEIQSIVQRDHKLSIRHFKAPNNRSVITELVGRNGRIFHTAFENPAVIPLEFTADRLRTYQRSFLRIRLRDETDKYRAWLQPFRLRPDV